MWLQNSKGVEKQFNSCDDKVTRHDLFFILPKKGHKKTEISDWLTHSVQKLQKLLFFFLDRSCEFERPKWSSSAVQKPSEIFEMVFALPTKTTQTQLLKTLLLLFEDERCMILWQLNKNRVRTRFSFWFHFHICGLYNLMEAFCLWGKNQRFDWKRQHDLTRQCYENRSAVFTFLGKFYKI